MTLCRRTLLAASLALTFAVALPTWAMPRPDLPRWHAVATPADKRFPAVAITLGYPGNYVPAENSPIELQLGGTTAFDGYIGFRFGVGRAMTRDIPVLMRAKTGREQPWLFSTYVQLNPSEYDDSLIARELVIDWYDRSGLLLARRSAGAPPWSGKRSPLRIVGPSENPSQIVKGTRIFLTPDLLGNEAQWYQGFSSVATPVDLWVDLPSPVRAAIFHSWTRMLFFVGLPRPDQRFDALDRAVIPVVFEPGEGEVEIPALYRRGSQPTRRTAVAWHARSDADTVGTNRNPYAVVATGANSKGLSLWAFEEHGFTESVPFTSATPAAVYKPEPEMSLASQLAVLAGLPWQFRPAVLVLTIGATSILLWIFYRRRARMVVLGIALIAAVLVLAIRQRVRPIDGSRIVERWTEVSPGVTAHRVNEDVFGRSPLPISRSATLSEQWFSSPYGILEDAEFRERSTLPGHGSMLSLSSPWDAASRGRLRYELGQRARVRVLSLSDEELHVEYEVDGLTTDKVLAQWTSNGVWREGESTIGNQRGVAKIETSRPITAIFDHWRLTTFRYLRGGENVQLAFVDDDPAHVRIVEWGGVFATPALVPYRLDLPVEGSLSWTFVFPDLPDQDGELYLRVGSRVAPARIELAGELGTIPIGPADRIANAKPYNETIYRVPVSKLASIAPPRYPLRLTIAGASDGLSWVQILAGRKPHE